jgi:hypothetical protein
MGLLVVLCGAFLPEKIHSKKVYSSIFYALLIVSWGMLIAFSIQGYGAVYIIFSILYIMISYWFAFYFYKEIKMADRTTSIKFAKASLLFLVISMVGPLALGPVMANEGNNTAWEMNLIYYFLHFQYNGWLIFGLLAVFFKWLEINKILYSEAKSKLFFWLMFGGCFPGYLLSVLWGNPAAIIYIIAGLGAFMHLLALTQLCDILKSNKKRIFNILHPYTRKLATIVFLAFCLKLFLQFLGVLPLIVRWTTAYRVLVIGYLHLVLLGIVTLSLFSVFIQKNILGLNKITLCGIGMFIWGFLLTEVLLFTEALLNISNTYIPNFNFWMFYATILLPIGATLMLRGHLTVMYISNKRYARYYS